MTERAKRHRLSNGTVIRVVRRPHADARNDCYGWTDGGIISINTRATRKGSLRELDTLLHELLHCEKWRMPEKEVTRISRSQARLLWALGWRVKK